MFTDAVVNYGIIGIITTNTRQQCCCVDKTFDIEPFIVYVVINVYVH